MPKFIIVNVVIAMEKILYVLLISNFPKIVGGVSKKNSSYAWLPPRLLFFEFYKYSSYKSSTYREKIGSDVKMYLFVKKIRLREYFQLGKLQLEEFHCIFYFRLMIYYSATDGYC